MRLCEGKPTLSVMPAEMRSIHEAAYKLFHGRGRSAVRAVTTICNKLEIENVDESGVVPLLDISSMQVSQVSAKYVLDFTFYHGGRRRVPSSIELGQSIFDEPITPDALSATTSPADATTEVPAAATRGQRAAATRLSGHEQRPAATSVGNRRQRAAGNTGEPSLLEESDDDSDSSASDVPRADDTSAARETAKRARENDLIDFGVRARARPRLTIGSERLPMSTHQPLLDNGASDSVGKGQFRASRLQNTVHYAIVNGTYAYMNAQLFVEQLQAQIELLAFLPHPAVLKGFYAWEFGTRGLSILHFGRLDVSSRRQRLRHYDMCDFSSSNSLPSPPEAEHMDDILAALDVLALLVEEVYQSFVGAVVTAARKFLLRKKTLRAIVDKEALADLVFWIDERLEKIRTRVVLGSTESCEAIQSEFNVAHESYVQVQNIIYGRQLARLEQ